MIHISFFCECKTEEEALELVNEILREINVWIDSYQILTNEPYWKIDGWYVVRCNLNTKTMDKQQIKDMLNKISDKWEWTYDSAYSCAINMGAVFINHSMKFVDCVFDNLMM